MRQKVAQRDTPSWLRAAEARINQQFALVSRLAPGSADHRLATEVLMILQDCLHTMSETNAIRAQLRDESEPLD